MGFLSVASSIVKTGSNVAGTVMSLGKTALSAGKSVLGSTIGKIGIGAGIIAAISRNSSAGKEGGILEGAKNLFGTVFGKIKSVGANILGKITVKTLDVGNSLRESVAEMNDAAEAQKIATSEPTAIESIQQTAQANKEAIDGPSI
jgi:hypothetical protein